VADLYKVTTSGDILKEVCRFHVEGSGKLYDIEKAYISFASFNCTHISSVETTSVSEFFLGPTCLLAKITDMFAEYFSRILSHGSNLPWMTTISLQTISSIFIEVNWC
jgi:hypothetical protein